MRRALVLLGGLLALASGCGAASSGSDPPASATRVPGDTRAHTLVSREGDGTFAAGPGEPFVRRGDPGRPVATLATWAQLTDVHIRDVESPARVPFLDRLGGPFSSTFRPQEALTLQVLDATVQTVDDLRPDSVVVTGDLADNAQSDELAEALRVLHGGTATMDTGARGPGGPQVQSDPDPFFYRPDLDAPRHAGLLGRADRPLRSPGLRAPWFALPGNHDLMVQGVVAPNAQLQRIATGDRRLVSLDLERLGALPRDESSLGRAVPELLRAGRTVHTAPDAGRRLLTPADAEAMLRRASGHGAALSPGGRFDYAFDLSPRVRGIALDLVRRDQGSSGLVDAATLAFLRRALAAAGSRPVVVFSHQALDRSQGGGAALALLRADPHVVALVSGDTHRNDIHRDGRLWSITTSSLIDWPQQARAFRLVRTAGGGLALETWMLDHGPGPDGLASISRQLAYLDAQGGRPQGFAGRRADRNAVLGITP